MKGIRFGLWHSYDDLNLILSGKEMGAPTVKSKKLDIPGADGTLDLTEAFGEPKYESVTHRFDFAAIVPQGEFPALFSKVKNAIHGKKTRIILDDDPLFAWVGRCYVSSFTNDRGIGTISVECDCEPYKYKRDHTTVSAHVDGTEVITLHNSRRRAVPEVQTYTDSGITIGYGSNTWTLGGGTYTLPELELTEGDNTVTVSGAGTVTFTWLEGDL